MRRTFPQGRLLPDNPPESFLLRRLVIAHGGAHHV